MSGRTYRVFLSAASRDLKSFRRRAKETLEEHASRVCPHGPLVVDYQEEFPPDYRDVWEILRQRILQSDAVICLVGTSDTLQILLRSKAGLIAYPITIHS